MIAAASTNLTREKMRIGSALRLLLVTAVCLAPGCGWHIQTELPPRPVPAEDVTDFPTLYRTNCTGCHGTDGTLGAAPPLNDALFLAIVPDEELLRVISDGRHDTLMPAWSKEKGGSLTEKQVKVLATGLKDPKQSHWAAAAKLEGDVPAYSLPKGKHGNREAGEKAFETACAGCHGAHGQGTKSAGALRDQAFLSLLSDQALRRIIITGRTDLGMPAYNRPEGRPDSFESLTEADIENLGALLDYWRTTNRSAVK